MARGATFGTLTPTRRVAATMRASTTTAPRRAAHTTSTSTGHATAPALASRKTSRTYGAGAKQAEKAEKAPPEARCSGGGDADFHVAPMRDYTDRHLRHLYRLFSSRCVLWSEMEKASAILDVVGGGGSNKRGGKSTKSGGRGLEGLLRRGTEGGGDERRRGWEVLQLGGDDPAQVAAAMRLSLPFGYDEINLNCGCPAIEAGGGDYGATLMRDGGDAAARVVSAMAAEASKRAGATVPVSVKCRVGIVERAEDFLPRDAPPEAVEARLFRRLERFAKKCVDAGAEHVVVHAREAVMAGLSPRGNREVPPLRPELAARLARELGGDVRVTLNGGVASAAAAAAAMARWPELDGVQAGRWPLRRPTDMLAVDDVFYGGQSLGGGGEGTYSYDGGEGTYSYDDGGTVGDGGGTVGAGDGLCDSSPPPPCLPPPSLRFADAGGAAAAAATRALESYVYRYALRELQVWTSAVAAPPW